MNKNYYDNDSDYVEEKNIKCVAPRTSGSAKCKPCLDDSYVVGNSVDFNIDNCDSEIKADITVNHRESVRVWGQIKDCSGKPVPYAYLKLIKVTNEGCYLGVAHTISDCLGFYQFDICPCADGTCFRILVGKASTGGKETTIACGLQGTNCNPCEYDPNCNCR